MSDFVGQPILAAAAFSGGFSRARASLGVRWFFDPVQMFLQPAYVLLSFLFFARRDDFLLPQNVGQVGNLRPIVNRPNAGRTYIAGGWLVQFAACRYVGQVDKRLITCDWAQRAPLIGQLSRASETQLPDRPRNFAHRSRRLKAGGSQDWLPHIGASTHE